MDIGKRNCKACIMNSDGSIDEESVYNNTLAEAEIFAYSIVKKYGKCVAECYIASREIREDRLLLRLRINLVQDRTRVMNRVHSLLDKYDVKCDYDNIFGVKGIRWLKSLKLSDNDKILLSL